MFIKGGWKWKENRILKMPIFFKISFISQSTQNLFAALRILNVNPASTAASLFVESNSAITSDMHSLFCHILCVFLLYSVPIANSPWHPTSSWKEPPNSKLIREHFFGGGFIHLPSQNLSPFHLDFVKNHRRLMSMIWYGELAPFHQTKPLESDPVQQSAADAVFAEGWSIKWHTLLSPSSAL